LANCLNKEFLGSYQFIISLFSLLSIFSLPGIKDSMLQSISNDYDSSLIIGTAYMIKYSLIGILILIIFSLYVLVFKNNFYLGYSILISSIFFPFFYTLDNYKIFLNAKKEFKKEFFYTSLTEVTKLIFVIFILLVFKNNFIIFICAFFVIQLIFYIIFFIKCKNRINNMVNIDKDLFSYGWFLNKLNAVAHIANIIDKVVIGMTLSYEILAIYSIAKVIPNNFRRAIKPVFYIFFPRFSNKEITLTTKKILTIFFLSIFIFLLLFLSIEEIIRIFFKNYFDSIKYGKILLIILIFFPVNTIFEFYYKGIKKRKVIKRAMLYSSLFLLFSILPALYLFNLWGIALVQVIKEAICFFIYIFDFFGYKRG
jgi:O-antigen/teichoic acid export membrane protein